MNVEKTIKFILARQAKIVAHQYKTDRRVDAIAKLLRTGMKKMLVEVQKAQKEAEFRMNALIDAHTALAEAQKRTAERLARSDEKFEKLMAALLRKRTAGRR